jgi:glycosyltransferase involved in cell wall biosynthesis
MKLLALIHGYPNFKNSGAEWMLHEMFKFLVEKGHDVSVRVPITEIEPYVLDGVRVGVDVYQETKPDLKECDLVITHLNRQGRAINICEEANKPCVVVHHNPNGFAPVPAKNKPTPQERWLYNIFNSEHVQKTLKYPNPSMILHPPVDPKRVKVKKGTKITLINCWPDKGGDVFASIAARMPDKKFLGVKGGYAETKQVISNHPNIEYIENTPDIKKVYARTRILLMPSIRESYGRTAVEAMISGIPVIAHPTVGLRECMGDAGIYIDRNDIEGWVKKITELDDPDKYEAASKTVMAKAKDIEADRIPSLERMEQFLIKAINRDL